MPTRLEYLSAKIRGGIELRNDEVREYIFLSPPLPPKLEQAVKDEVWREMQRREALHLDLAATHRQEAVDRIYAEALIEFPGLTATQRPCGG